jgi:biopolymer transport protein ExbD
MRKFRKMRMNDSSFELNLAPFLDIIVSIIPMLLLSVAFVQIKMIETSIPQVVADKIEQQKKDPPKATLTLEASRQTGFTLVVNESGKVKKTALGLKAGKLDYDGLHKVAVHAKRSYSDVFKMDFLPKADLTYDEIVLTMDSVRRMPAGEKISFRDTKTGQDVQTDLMFPDVTFANVVGE